MRGGFLPNHDEVACISDYFAILLFRKTPGFCNVQDASWGGLWRFEVSCHNFGELMLNEGAHGI